MTPRLPPVSKKPAPLPASVRLVNPATLPTPSSAVFDTAVMDVPTDLAASAMATVTVPHNAANAATVPESSVATSAGAPVVTPFQPFGDAPELATQDGSKGVRFDFNDGCRLLLPEGDWKVCLRDSHTRNTLFETRIGAGSVGSSKKYFVPFEIEVRDAAQADKFVVQHTFDARNRLVLIQFPVGTLGDLMGWFPYAVKFQAQHGCKLTCSMSALITPLFKACYPDIEFLTPEEVKPGRFYATYRVGLFFDDDAHIHQPCDFRLVGLHRTAGYILGVDPSEVAPQLDYGSNGDTRPIEEPYVCIASQSSTQCKYWNHPGGWRDIVGFLKAQGYRVICIDQKPIHGHGMVWNHLPYGSEDQTGDQSLTERARWLKHADFFVGLSSGLSWLAWATNKPVVMISGFTHPTNEFETPHRVINYHTCNGCWNDVRVRFDHKDFLWCPRHAGTDRQFECTRLITPDQVKTAIRSIPGFAVPVRSRLPSPA